MKPLVLEIQAAAMDPEVPASRVLRMALVAASKLDVEEMRAWAEKELQGYAEADSAPAYRTLPGRIGVFDPHRGWLPIHFEEGDLAQLFSSHPLGVSIPELEDILTSSSTDKAFSMPLPHAVESQLLQHLHLRATPVFRIQRSGLHRIVEAARDAALRWALKLEAAGVRGEGLSFSSEEARQAQSIVFNIGTVQQSQLQVATTGSSQEMPLSSAELGEWRALVADLRLRSAEVGGGQQAELEADLATLEAQLASPAPKSSIVVEAGKSVRSVLESAAGSILASGFLQRLTLLLG